MRSTKPRKLRPTFTIPELKEEVSKIANHLADVHERLPGGLPDDVALQVAGAFKFMRMTTTSLMVAESVKDREAEWTLTPAIPVIRQAVSMGFSGNCFAAAVALNRALFGDRLSYYIAVNDALHAAGRSIGHVTLFMRDGKGIRRHIDADGHIKGDTDAESWGMLDPEDSDYQEIVTDLGVEWNDETAGTVAMFEATESDVMRIANDAAKVRELESILLRAAVETGYQVTVAGSLRREVFQQTPDASQGRPVRAGADARSDGVCCE